MSLKRLCIILLFGVLIVNGCTEKEPANNGVVKPVEVITLKVQKTSIDKEISVSGNVEGNKTARLGFLVAGKINYIAGDEGSTISAGQLLASLDSESYRNARDMADANFAQVQDEYNRLSIMHEGKSVSDSDFVKVSNMLKGAKAQQNIQNKNLRDTKIYAPFSGVLLKRGPEIGEIIGPGTPLFIISDIRTVKINAAVPGADLRHVKIGNTAHVCISSIDKTMTGKIVEVGSLSEPTTRTFNVKIELQNSDLSIRPGMTAEVKITSGLQSDVMAIPVEAILRDADNSSYVYVVDEKKAQAFKRKVSLGQIIGNNFEITSGLNVDDLIVVGGQHKLENGSSIKYQ